MQSRGSSKSSYGSGKGKGKGKGMRWQKVATPTTPATARAAPSSSFEMRPDAPIFVNISSKTKEHLYYLAGQMAAQTMYDVFCHDAYLAAQQALQHQYYFEGQCYQPSLQQLAHYQQDYGAAAGYSHYGAYAPARPPWKGGSTMPKKVNGKADIPAHHGQAQGRRQKGKLPLPAGAIATASTTTPAESPSMNPAAAPFLPAAAVLDEPSQGGADTSAGSTASAIAPEPEVVAEAAPTEPAASTDAAPQEVPPSTSGIPTAGQETSVSSDVPTVVAVLESEEAANQDHDDGIPVKNLEPGQLTLWASTKAAFGNRRTQLLLMGIAAGTAITAASIIRNRHK